MILVTRLNGPRFAVNPDLLQRVESTPDTILTLIDGTKYIVAESIDDVTRLVVEYRARVVAATVDMTGRAPTELLGVEPTAPPTDEKPDAERVAPVTELRRASTLRSVPEVD